MKKQVAVIFITLSLGAFSWAQGTQDPFDVKKSREELEIMKGILNTTISFIAESDSQMNIQRNPNIDAFYLAGQGAVFVIPISSFRAVDLELSKALEATKQSLDELRYNLNLETLYDGSLILPAPPAPPAPPATPAPPNQTESPVSSQEYLKMQSEKQKAILEEARAKAAKSREEVSKKREEVLKQEKVMLEEYKARAEKRREEAQKRREKLLQSLADIKIHLIETLANYGDSLGTLQSDEYINLILNTDDPEGGRKKRFETISARKSWITDYKAGRSSLEDFKRKVVQYTQ